MWALIASLYIGNVLLLVLNLPLIGIWIKVLQIPRPYLYAGILTFAALGSYSVGASVPDLILLFLIGILGWAMRTQGYPVGSRARKVSNVASSGIVLGCSRCG